MNNYSRPVMNCENNNQWTSNYIAPKTISFAGYGLKTEDIQAQGMNNYSRPVMNCENNNQWNSNSLAPKTISFAGYGLKTEDIQAQGMNNYSRPVMNCENNNQWNSNSLAPKTISFAGYGLKTEDIQAQGMNNYSRPAMNCENNNQGTSNYIAPKTISFAGYGLKTEDIQAQGMNNYSRPAMNCENNNQGTSNYIAPKTISFAGYGLKTEDIQAQGMNNYSRPAMNCENNNQRTSNYIAPKTISFANPGLFDENDFCNLPQQQALLALFETTNPNLEPHNNFIQLMISNKQCVTVSDRDFRAIPNNASYNPRESTIDPNISKKGEILPEVAKNNLLLLEEKLVADSTLNKVQQYSKLCQPNEKYDVVLTFENGEEIKAHRTVLLQSPYFKEVFQAPKSLPSEPVQLLMSEYLRPNSFEKVLRYMYYAEIETHELDVMDPVMAKEIFMIAEALSLYSLMSIVLVRVIIPKMDEFMCVELLKDSSGRENEESKLIWETLQGYCFKFFALHSKSILNKYPRLPEGIDAKLIYKMINKALTKCSDIQHMYELLSILIQNGFAADVLDILERVPFVTKKDRQFDTKYIENIRELLISLDPKSCYITDLITINKHLVNSILEENNQVPSTMDISAGPLSHHLELNLRHNANSQEFLEPNEWPEIKNMDPMYEMKIQLALGAKNKSIISQSFDSDSRSWRLILDIEDDYKVSAFLVEEGNPSHALFGTPFKKEFTSVKFLIQIQHGEIEYETILFHTFANEHHYSVGHRKFAFLPNLAVDNKIQVRVWMMEFPVYSSTIQYISTRFNDLLKASSQNQDISEILTLKPVKLDNVDPLAAHTIHPINRNLRQVPEIQSLVPEMGTQQQRLQELNPYDFYYLVSSDYLKIEHEKPLIDFLLTFHLEKSQEMVTVLFNAARDSLALRDNLTFFDKLDFEVGVGTSSHQSFERPRRFYSTEMYKDWNSKDQVLHWVVESDHHEAFRLQVDELENVIEMKEQQLEDQEALVPDLSLDIEIMNALSQRISKQGRKEPKFKPPRVGEFFFGRNQQQNQRPSQHANQSISTPTKDKCNIF